ncbi:MAG: hypothetical protein COU30_01580 [Candidatus Magasanikbacteria bacterium CG10_big_fil_rev_8_21_14_0_10_38_6]|uniref:Uncharacterized protein n=1 Tax=Candidatus Magasanikbacteria bacterium CG10_big_fil_rev_8_21_14_0_10_38_6 TaxID=1974647 RepID=A0A2M6P1J9_9BACT|nr:MAG: hypothetical protein COU30_01580 [Candidatus Magasanikbacteria bacterium CG10_big_fil_rev_8_21_14_0_10_38_6]
MAILFILLLLNNHVFGFMTYTPETQFGGHPDIPDGIKKRIEELPPDVVDPPPTPEPDRPRIEIPLPPPRDPHEDSSPKKSYGDGSPDSYGWGGSDEDDEEGVIKINLNDIPVMPDEEIEK